MTAKLTPTDLRAIARYEKTFESYPEILEALKDEESFDPEEYIRGDYPMTLDDLIIALKNIKAAEPTVEFFYTNWYNPMFMCDEIFHLESPVDNSENMSMEENRVLSAMKLPENKATVFTNIWNRIGDWIWEAIDTYDVELSDGTSVENGSLAPVTEFLDIDEYLRYIEEFLEQSRIPVFEREFTKENKQDYIKEFLNEAYIKRVSDKEIDLCRRFTDELCEDNDETALRIKGYGCYGGNRLYECDWVTSRDCMIKLLDITDDAVYANTLGYIYYYGRCNNGVPEYEKAFEMFTMGAANTFYESTYKLADMYYHGYGCRKSAKTAKRLYQKIYDETLNRLEKGEMTTFPDAALRMGNVYMKGIGTEKDPEEAFRYYLQAVTTAKIRAATNEFFGNTTVAIAAAKAMEEARHNLPKGYFKKYISTEEPGLMYALLYGNWRVSVSADKADGDNLKLKFNRVAVRKDQAVEKILISAPELNECYLSAGFEITAVAAKISFKPGEEIIFDDYEYDSDDKRWRFVLNGHTAAWLKCKGFRYYASEKKSTDDELVHLVSVSFYPGGRTYDYICEIPGVEPGDTVIVPGLEGDTEVTVEKVFSKRKSDLPLPVSKYKKISLKK